MEEEKMKNILLALIVLVNGYFIFTFVKDLIKHKDSFKEEVKGIKLPAFYMKSKVESLFNSKDESIKLTKII